jgi:hypothetical protein
MQTMLKLTTTTITSAARICDMFKEYKIKFYQHEIYTVFVNLNESSLPLLEMTLDKMRAVRKLGTIVGAVATAEKIKVNGFKELEKIKSAFSDYKYYNNSKHEIVFAQKVEKPLLIVTL